MAKKTDPQGLLFERRQEVGSWKPNENLPDLAGLDRIWMDLEYDATPSGGGPAELCGISINGQYLPVNHKEGGNLDEDKVRYWAKKELRKKTIVNIATGLDARVMKTWGVDLEEQGCTLHDVSHSAALIDENRFKGPNLDELAAEYLPDHRRKLQTGVRPQNFHQVHSSMIGPYAEEDSLLVRDVDAAQRPLIARDHLERVESLEDRLIWPNNHMEDSGMRMDVPKLTRWVGEAQAEFAGLAMEIWTATGIRLFPNKASSWHELYTVLKLKTPEYPRSREKRGKYGLFMVSVPEGYTDDFLKKQDHPMVKKGLRMRRLSSLQSKYLEKYLKALKGDKLAFQLYQLRASEEDYGTVVGRYSSANVNIQQVFKPENQERRFGPGFCIRELMIPDEGFDMFAVDGSQLQFRLFAHFSRDPVLQAAYRDNPDIDFHQMVADLFGLNRQAAKHNNFAMVLGMGREKLASRIGMPCTCRDEEHWSRRTRALIRDPRQKREHIFGINDNHAEDCRARESNDQGDRYDADFPAAKRTMEAVTEAAEGKHRVDSEGRGYVVCLSGRRTRYVAGDKFYSAFAALLQGCEADVVKTKILELYNERKTVGIHKLRAPVHDEATGDIEKDAKKKKLFEELCSVQNFELKVPIVWTAGYGPNWAACH